jgi:hypothetical protein
MDEHQIAEIWSLFKEYLDKKTCETAAERYVELLVELGVSDRVITEAVGHDAVLDEAISYYVDADEESEEPEDE